MTRIAFVFPISNAYVHRLAHGAFAYSETCPGLMVREFQVKRGSLKSAGEHDTVSQLLEWKPDGILGFLETAELGMLLDRLPAPCPVVSMCAVQRKAGVAVLCGSFAAEVKVAANHFREQGIRSVAMFSSENEQPSWMRVFQQVAKPLAGRQAVFWDRMDAALLDDPYRPVNPVSERLKDWLESLPKPTGVFCREIGAGSYIIRVCKSIGLRVPEDVAVIGSDDADNALATSPTLTTVIPLGATIGFEAARLLAQMLAGKPTPEEAVRFEAMDLRVRESTGVQRAQVCDIAAALDHINQHACGGLSVAELHKATQQVCGKTFHTHFKAATGLTPSEGIQRRQFEEARRLLAATRISVTLVAEKCGFSSSSDFARRFRVVVGMSPSEYRKDRQEAGRSDS